MTKDEKHKIATQPGSFHAQNGGAFKSQPIMTKAEELEYVDKLSLKP